MRLESVLLAAPARRPQLRAVAPLAQHLLKPRSGARILDQDLVGLIVLDQSQGRISGLHRVETLPQHVYNVMATSIRCDDKTNRVACALGSLRGGIEAEGDAPRIRRQDIEIADVVGMQQLAYRGRRVLLVLSREDRRAARPDLIDFGRWIEIGQQCLANLPGPEL